MPTASPRYHHVIWDWNGTLLDDARLCVDVMNGVLRSRALPPLTLERYQEIFDFPVIRYYERLGFDFARDPFEVVGTEFIRNYETRRHEAGLQAGARELLELLRHFEVGQSVLSAYRHDTLETLLRHHGVREFFHRVVGSDDHYATGKVEQGRRFIAELGLPPADVVLIGDTTHDHEVAVAMGIECLLLPCGNHSRARLEACGVPVLDSLSDLPARLFVNR